MHPDRVIVCMDIFSDGLSMRQDGPNTLTCQSTGMHDAPRDPLHGPVIGHHVYEIFCGLNLLRHGWYVGTRRTIFFCP